MSADGKSAKLDAVFTNLGAGVVEEYAEWSETDTFLNPAGVKGLGELGNVGTAAAISSAIFHATGKRVRDLPIRIEDIL